MSLTCGCACTSSSWWWGWAWGSSPGIAPACVVLMVAVVHVDVVVIERVVPVEMMVARAHEEHDAADHQQPGDDVVEPERLRQDERRDESPDERCDREDRRLARGPRARNASASR